MAPGWRNLPAGLLLVLASCGSPTPSVATSGHDGSGASGITTQAWTSGAASTGAAETSGEFPVPQDDVGPQDDGGTSEGADEPLVCRSDAECDDVGCLGGLCQSCDDFPEGCVDDEVCVADRCRRREDLTACEGRGYAICGDAILQPTESCDGGPECEDCVSATAQSQAFGDPMEASSIAVGPDGRIAAVVRKEDDTARLLLADPDGTVRSVTVVPGEPKKPIWGDGQLFVPGLDEEYRWVVVAVRSDGQVQWSRDIMLRSLGPAAVFEGGLVLGGAVDQPNSSTTRGMLVRLDPDGETVWEEKQPEVGAIASLAVTEDDVVFAGTHIGLPRTVVASVDARDGAAHWSDDSAPAHSGTGRVFVFDDANNGTWFFSDDGTAIHFGANGDRLDTIPCFGFVAGGLAEVARGPGSEVALRFYVYGETFEGAQTWVVSGMPDSPQRAAWASATGSSSMGSLTWTPEGRLLALRSGDSRVHEVTF